MDTENPKSGFNVASFVLDRYVRLAWIAFFTLWTLWGLVYFLRHIFGEDQDKPAPAEEDAEAAAKRAKWKPEGGFGSRLANAYRVLFENTQLLLPVLVLNTFGTGSTRAVAILAWIYFALTAIVAFTEVGYGHRFIRFVYSAVFYGITLAIGGLAFSHGW
ncbi:hypothetical protein BDB00DRAFT_834068 [Zychaea mexicana]|uniref:uncharacterized protein n=1 Tax=Zychaea mexicana TaxID=64656 RepID=UPI0022FF0CF1|nr:uncharacterized protein BDB00DRAFT_834068 [Zychaea mexicana]KAI9491164.1 hypothetical protein BDB00DRAFT_834068 [Zychaea mexicana]